MLNEFFENNGTKRISRGETLFIKNIFPFFLGFIALIIVLISLLGKEYLILILYSPFILAITVAMFMAYKMKIADEVYLDYNNREFIFLYKKGGEIIRKSFTDMTSVKKMAWGQTIELGFNESEKKVFYSRQQGLLDYSVYNEIKMILESDIGNFLQNKPEM